MEAVGREAKALRLDTEMDNDEDDWIPCAACIKSKVAGICVRGPGSACAWCNGLKQGCSNSGSCQAPRKRVGATKVVEAPKGKSEYFLSDSWSDFVNSHCPTDSNGPGRP